MKRVKKIVLVGIVIFLALPAASLILSEYLKQKIQVLLNQSCPACDFHAESFQINFFTGDFSGHLLSFVSDPKRSTVIKVGIDELTVRMSLLELIRRKIKISAIKLSGLKVKIEEKYDPNHGTVEKRQAKESADEFASSYGGKWLEELPAAAIDGITIGHGSLEYILKIFGKEARIVVSDIQADISPLGTRKSIGPRFINANLTGRLQKTGLVTFRCRADLFSVKNQDQIEIDVQHQNMTELNSFFVNEDGIEMSGEVKQAHALLNLSQGHLSGDLWTHYRDLSLHILPTPETGKIEAALTNFFQSLKVAKTKPLPEKPPPRASVLYERKPSQGLIKFILQGLKEAAFKAVSN